LPRDFDIFDFSLSFRDFPRISGGRGGVYVCQGVPARWRRPRLEFHSPFVGCVSYVLLPVSRA
jgi:hypothetical protein